MGNMKGTGFSNPTLDNGSKPAAYRYEYNLDSKTKKASVTTTVSLREGQVNVLALQKSLRQFVAELEQQLGEMGFSLAVTDKPKEAAE